MTFSFLMLKFYPYIDDMNNMREFFIFTISDNTFALPLECVDTVVRSVALVRLPDAARGLRGLLDLRGTLVPVIDVNARLNLPTGAIRVDQRLVIAHHGARSVAFIVDVVESVVAVDHDEMVQGDEIYPAMDRYVQAIIWQGEQKILLCDPLEFLVVDDPDGIDGVGD